MSAVVSAVVRTFGIGAACGFVAGALLVGALVWQYGSSGRARARAPRRWRSTGARTDGGIGSDAGSTAARQHARSRAGAAPAAAADDGVAGRSARIPQTTVRRRRGADAIAIWRSRSKGSRPQLAALDVRGSRAAERARTRRSTSWRRGTRRSRPSRTAPIARLFYSKAGGITVYQFDPSERYCYYYAHLERYADGLNEGDRVKKGQVLGYVGTSGNAPKNTPHLHFAIFRLTAEKHWWEGTPIDPYDILR